MDKHIIVLVGDKNKLIPQLQELSKDPIIELDDLGKKLPACNLPCHP
jgi:hypothetical protein